MEKNNVFTIIVTSYNNQQYMKECLKSVIEQTYESIELIISDDCSTYFDIDDITSFIEGNSKKNIIKYIININDRNIGSVRNINTALKLSTGNYIMILACDDLLYDKNVLTDIVKYFEREECQGVVGFIEMYDTEMKNVKALFPRQYALTYVNNHEAIDIFYKLCEKVILAGPGFTFKREVIDVYGLYDEDYVLVEDYPRYLYLTRNGCRIRFMDRKLIKYRDGGITNQISNQNNSNIKMKIKKDLKLVREKEILPYTK